MIKAGFNKIIPIRAPTHQTGNFEKVPIMPHHIFHSWALDPCESLDLSPLRDNLIYFNDFFETHPITLSRYIVILAYRQSFSGNL
jgi:hypothetical protein